MNNFTPDVGVLFYAVNTTHRVVEGRSGGVDVLERVRDVGNDNKIFRCVAVDDRMIVADVVYGDCYGRTRRTLIRQDIKAVPVGPEVRAALGIEA